LVVIYSLQNMKNCGMKYPYQYSFGLLNKKYSSLLISRSVYITLGF